MKNKFEDLFLLLITFLTLSLFFLATFLGIQSGDFEKLSALLLPVSFWYAYFFLFILAFCWATWLFLDSCYPDKPSVSDVHIPLPLRDSHIAKYNHVHDEITRYRNLSWQITALTWGMYYGLNWFLFNGKEFYSQINYLAYFAAVYLTAVFATIFLLFCEHTANRNRVQRRELEGSLLVNAQWRHTLEGEKLTRPGFWFSVGVFHLAIWVPALAMLLLKKTPSLS